MLILGWTIECSVRRRKLGRCPAENLRAHDAVIYPKAVKHTEKSTAHLVRSGKTTSTVGSNFAVCVDG